MNNMKRILLITCMLFTAMIAFSQSTFRNYSDLQSFMSRRPTFESVETGLKVTLNYTKSSGYYIEVGPNSKRIDIVDVSLNPSQPNMAILGVQWLSEPAPLFIDMRNSIPFLILPAIPGEEAISVDSMGRIQPGRTRRTNWMRLTMGGDGIQFTPYDAAQRPEPEYFKFIEYKN